jgi:hypothetical protein
VGNATAKILHYMKFAELLGVPSQPIEWHFELHSEEEEKVNILLDKERNSALCCSLELAGRVSGGFRVRSPIARVFSEKTII